MQLRVVLMLMVAFFAPLYDIIINLAPHLRAGWECDDPQITERKHIAVLFGSRLCPGTCRAIAFCCSKHSSLLFISLYSADAASITGRLPAGMRLCIRYRYSPSRLRRMGVQCFSGYTEAPLIRLRTRISSPNTRIRMKCSMMREDMRSE